jgi:hypothetical protein
MNETVASCIILLIFLFLSFFFHQWIVNVKSKLLLVLVIILYITYIYYYYDFLAHIDHVLATRGISIDFGHADIGLVLIFFLSVLIAIGNIVYALFKRKINSKKSK